MDCGETGCLEVVAAESRVSWRAVAAGKGRRHFGRSREHRGGEDWRLARLSCADGASHCLSSTLISTSLIMAALRTPSASFLSAFLPVARASLAPETSTLSPIRRRIPLLQHLRTSLLPAALVPIPSLIGELWEGILKAVPKKKTSHMKKRHRFMAGKGLKDVTALNKCSACGRPKRAHVLCPYCVQSKSRLYFVI